MPTKLGTAHHFLAEFASRAQIITPLLLVLLSSVCCWAQPPQTGYFYQQQAEQPTSGRSCASIFTELHTGKGEDVGGVVKSLKTISVQYLLEDYDNALSRDRRKKDYVQLDNLLQEVERNKREIYCKIELALYLRSQEEFAGPVYDDLLAEAFSKLEATYASAKKSFEQGELERALYAFDLIAPYKDAAELYLQVDNQQQAAAAEQQVASVEPVADMDKPGGPIASALRSGFPEVLPPPAEQPQMPGPIALAARTGPIVSALQAIEAEVLQR